MPSLNELKEKIVSPLKVALKWTAIAIAGLLALKEALEQILRVVENLSL